MKIILSTSLGGASYLHTLVFLLAPRNHIRTSAIIDTGSPENILSYANAIRLQIPVNNLKESEIIKIGGSIYNSKKFDKLKIKFLSDEGKVVEEKISVKIVQPTSPRNLNSGFDLIIGNDFLKREGYKLYSDMKNDVAYLEK